MIQPPALFFQRQAGVWLDMAREQAVGAGAALPTMGHSSIELLEVLRAELLVRLGSDLAAIHRQRNGMGGLAAAPTANGKVNGGLWRTWWDRLHYKAYCYKRDLLRNVGSPLSVSRRTDGRQVVMVVARTLGHVADTLPVVELLRDNCNFISVFAVTDRRIARRVKTAGFPVCNFYVRRNRVGKAQISRCLSTVDPLCQSLQGLLAENDLFDSQQMTRLIESTRQILQDRAANAFQQAYSVDCLIEGLSPTLVLVGNPYTIEGKLSALVARDYGVAAAAIEHGTTCDDDPRWHRCPLDLVCAWGEPSRRALEHNGVPSERIALTGSPRHDRIFCNSAVRAAGRNAPEPTILVATSGPGDQVGLVEHQRFIAMLTTAVGQAPDLRWLVKLHPKDRPEHYRSLLDLGSDRVEIVRGKSDGDGSDIFEFLKSARALVTVTSSTALDAMSVRVPVIAVDVWQPDQRPQGIAFMNRGCTRRAGSAAELAAKARAAWNFEPEATADQAAREYIDEQFVEQGTAAQAVARQLAALVERYAHRRTLLGSSTSK